MINKLRKKYSEFFWPILALIAAINFMSFAVGAMKGSYSHEGKFMGKTVWKENKNICKATSFLVLINIPYRLGCELTLKRDWEI